jgi:hypothetical protein
MMKNFKLYLLFPLLSILFLIVGFLTTEESLVVNGHDTYYVILYCYIYWFYSVVFLVLFGIYGLLDLLKIKFNKTLSKGHVLGTIISIIGLNFPYHLIFKTSDFPLFDDSDKTNLYLTVFAILFVSFQMLFFISVFITIIRSGVSFISRKK